VRILFWFLLLAAAAVGVALAVKVVSGYVLFVAPPYRVELSLNLLLLLLIAGFIGGYALLRLALRMAALPRDVRALRRRQQEARARGKLDAAIVALLEGPLRKGATVRGGKPRHSRRARIRRAGRRSGGARHARLRNR
jgi:HemY protein